MNTAQAKTIKIADYLQSLGYSPAKIQGYNYWYCSPYREERTASFKVDTNKNTWHDFGTGEGGDIIDLAQKIWNCSVETALQKLSGTPTNLSFFQSKKDLQENPSTQILNICQISHPKLIEWVKERKIDLHLANLYCREIHYRNQSGQFFSVGFRNDKGEWKSLITPHEGEYPGETYFVQSDFWDIPAFKISGVLVPESVIVNEKPFTFTLLSDGCQDTAWIHYLKDDKTGRYSKPNKPYSNFFNPLCETLQSFRKDKVVEKERAEKWEKFIESGNSSFIKERDDKTMILGVIVN